MIGLLSGIFLLLLAVLALGLQRLYSSIPARELKRLARRGDHLAGALYRPVAYGASLRVLLWLMGVAALVAGLLLAMPHLPLPADFALFAAVLSVVLVLVPSLQLTVRAAEFAARAAPAVVWMLGHVHAPLSRIAGFINRFRDLTPHSLLYEKEDLQQLLASQKERAGNRIALHYIEMAERALTFGDKQAADVVQSPGSQCFVNADDTIGPVLLDQLHKSKQSSFLVYKDSRENIIGSLSMRDAVGAKHDGRVFDLVRGDLIYVHENFSLQQVLAAFQKTGHQLAVVVNNFEEFVGTITFDNLLRELLGEANDDGMDNYENRTSVATYRPKTDAEATSEKPEVTDPSGAEATPSSPEATEVIE